jgi:phosphoglycolate phosphatase-like HAD superfamily hydrolase
MGPSTAPPRAVVFDLDGTLVDTMPGVVRAFAHAIAPFVTPPPPDTLHGMLGGPVDRCLRQLLGSDLHLAEARARLFAFGGEPGLGAEAFAGAHALLAAMQKARVRLGLWSGRDRASGLRLLRGLELEHYFDAMVFGDDLTTHKPDPEGLEAVLAALGSASREAVFVGDADVDVVAAAAAGVELLFVRHGRRLPAETEQLVGAEAPDPATAYRMLWARCGC